MATLTKAEPLAPLDPAGLTQSVQSLLDAAVPTTVTDEMRAAAAKRLGPAEVNDDLVLAWAVLSKTQRLIDESEATLSENHERRNAFMLSMVFYDNLPAKQVADAAGVTRASIFKIIARTMVGEAEWTKKRPGGKKPTWRASDHTADERTRLARKRGVRKYADARDELARVAPMVWAAQLMLEEAVKFRDPAIRTLVTAEALSQDEVAKIIHRNPSRVSHIVTGKGAGNPPK